MSSIVISCSRESSSLKLEGDPNVNEIYDAREIDALRLILDLFDSAIQSKVPDQEIHKAYHYFFCENFTDERYIDLGNDIGWEYSEEIKSLVDTLMELNVLDSIYKFSHSCYTRSPRKRNYRDAITLEIRMYGKYLKMLAKAGDDYKIFKRYRKRVLSSGGNSSPSIRGIMIQHCPTAGDFKHEIVRLHWAVHYISVFSTRYFDDFRKEKNYSIGFEIFKPEKVDDPDYTSESEFRLTDCASLTRNRRTASDTVEHPIIITIDTLNNQDIR